MFFFLEEFFVLLFGKMSPEFIRKRNLKKLKKNINASRYKRFYRAGKQELTPAAGKFFFEIYRAVSSAQVAWKGVASSAGFKNTVIRHFVPPETLALLDELTEEALLEKMKQRNAKDVAREAREYFQTFLKALDRLITEEVDNCCYQALLFEQFISFDHYFLLKKFGSNFREHAISGNYNFTAARGSLISDQLKDYLYVAIPLDQKQDWTTILKLLKTWNGTDAIRPDQWLKALSQIQDVNNTHIFEFIIRHIDGDPDWNLKIPKNREPVLTPWGEARRRDLEALLDKLVHAQWNVRISYLARQIFGEEPVLGLSYYTEKAGETLVEKGFQGFIYAEGLNYLAAFIAIFDREFRELCELLMIRAIWSTTSQSRFLMEQSLFLTDLIKKISVFDEGMKEDGMWGFKLYQSLAKSSADRLLVRSIQDSLSVVNNEAKNFLVAGSQAFAVIQRTIEEAKNDYISQTPLLILNWQVLEQAAIRPLDAWLAAASEKLTPLVNMMSLFIQDPALSIERKAPLK